MRLVKSANTQPELALRRLVHGLGFRYRINNRDVVGRPDVANRSRRIAIFVHGCFWHRHDCPAGRRTPKSRIEFWSKKFQQNVKRDRTVEKQLRDLDWRSLIVWECEFRSSQRLTRRLRGFLDA